MSEDTFHLGIKALLRNHEGNVLLLQVNPDKLQGGLSERKDYWDLPGGRVQKGQTVPETLRREVAEETGLADITNIKEVGMVLANFRIPVGNDTVGLILGVYECDVRGSNDIVLSDEHTGYEWFAPSEAARLLTVKYPQHFCDLIAAL